MGSWADLGGIWEISSSRSSGSGGSFLDGQDRNHLDEAGQVVFRPDIVWKIRGSAVAVVDAKYKTEKPAGYPNALERA